MDWNKLASQFLQSTGLWGGRSRDRQLGQQQEVIRGLSEELEEERSRGMRNAGIAGLLGLVGGALFLTGGKGKSKRAKKRRKGRK